MTDSQHPEIDSGKVADLQGQLNSAAAQLAKVQAELAAAQGTGTAAASAGPGIPAAGAVPYGSAPGVYTVSVDAVDQPGVVTINGHPINFGDGHQLTNIVQAMRAAHDTGASGMPQIFLNGQQVPAGQQVNIASMFNPQQLAKIQGAMASLQSTHPEYARSMAAMFGGAGAAGLADGQPGTQAGVPYDASSYADPSGGFGGGGGGGGSSYSFGETGSDSGLPTPTSVAPIADPPRHVPFVYRLATFDLSLVEIFVLFMVAIAPIALWMSVPQSAPFGFVLVSLAVIAYRVHKYVGRIGMLKWGKVATVTGTDLRGVGTYYSGTTYQNMRMRQAHGWTAETHWYNGPGYHTKINYTLDSYQGVFSLHGLAYDNGVILAHSKHPKRAMCVSGFPYVVTPTSDGHWPGKLSAWLWGGIVATLAIEGCVIYLTVLVVMDNWFS